MGGTEKRRPFRCRAGVVQSTWFSMVPPKFGKNAAVFCGRAGVLYLGFRWRRCARDRGVPAGLHLPPMQNLRAYAFLVTLGFRRGVLLEIGGRLGDINVGHASMGRRAVFVRRAA